MGHPRKSELQLHRVTEKADQIIWDHRGYHGTVDEWHDQKKNKKTHIEEHLVVFKAQTSAVLTDL